MKRKQIDLSFLESPRRRPRKPPEPKKDKGIRWLKDKGVYLVTISYGTDENGERIRRSKTFKDIEDAREYKAQAEFEKGHATAPLKVNRIKLIDYLAEYLRDLDISPSTRSGYENMLKHVKKDPILARKHLQEIASQDIRGYLRRLKETTHMKPQSINKNLTFIQSALDRAWKDEIIEKNFAKMVDKYPIREKDKHTAHPLTKDKLEVILGVLKTYPNQNVKLVFYLGALIGLRRGEMLGLRWENVHLFEKEPYIHIVENRVRVGGKMITKEPKSDTSTRSIRIEPLVQSILFEQLQYQSETFGGCEYVMVSPRSGKPISPVTLEKHFKQFLRENNFDDMRIHDLRHTCGTLLVQAEIPVKSVSYMLGHSDSRITEKIYIHPTDNMNEKAARAVANLFEGKI